MMTEPVAIHVALLYRPPIKLTNRMRIRAPISCEAGIREDLELVSWNCRSMAGRPALAIPLMANPSRKQKRTNHITNTQVLFMNCSALKQKKIICETRGENKSGFEVVNIFGSTQMSMYFILLIDVKMPTNVGILTF